MKTLFLAAALSATSLAAGAYPLADLRTEQTKIVAQTRGVDFGDAAQVAVLHQTLARRATQICDSRQPRSLAVIASDRACAREALDRAVAQAHEPMLTAYHQGSSPGRGRFAQR